MAREDVRMEGQIHKTFSIGQTRQLIQSFKNSDHSARMVRNPDQLVLFWVHPILGPYRNFYILVKPKIGASYRSNFRIILKNFMVCSGVKDFLKTQYRMYPPFYRRRTQPATLVRPLASWLANGSLSRAFAIVLSLGNHAIPREIDSSCVYGKVVWFYLTGYTRSVTIL